MKKAPEAFRTISEVADILDTPAHVLRFWESKFYQIRPVKRAGGRRYYRPDDVALINGIKSLLQTQGMTIRGVQRVLQEQGVKHVAGLGGPLRELAPASDSDETIFDGLESEDDFAIEDAEILPDAPRLAAAEPETLQSDVPLSDSVPEPATLPVEESLPEDEPLVPKAEPVMQGVPAGQPVPADEDAASYPGPVEEPPLGTMVEDDLEPAEAVDLAPEPADDIEPDALVPPEDLAPEPVEPEPEPEPEPVAMAPETAEVMEPSERAMLARRLRAMPRGTLGPRRDRAEMLARRIDALLERMSEASGAGRW